MVKDFLQTYATLLVNHPDDISIEIEEMDEGFDEITIFAHSEDIGKLSGCKAKGGKNYRVNVKAAG